jgi:hypothetical protein
MAKEIILKTVSMEKKRKYRVPRQDGEILVDPAFDEMPGHIERNYELLAGYDFDVAGANVAELRESLRGHLNIASGGRLPEDKPLIMLAHQPGFYNPGVLFKYELLQRLGRYGCALEVVVDSDVESSIHFKIPSKTDGRFHVNDFILCDNENNAIFERLKAPERKVFDNAFAESIALVKTLPFPETAGAIEKFDKIIEKNLDQNTSMSDLMVACRKGYFPTPDIFSISLGRICSRPEFKAFAVDLIFNIQRYAECYNNSLDEYRNEVRERYRANPFPNLSIEGDVFEAPFWIVNKDGSRSELYVDITGDTAVLLDGEGRKIANIEAGDVSGLDDIDIRPKAITLTTFHRVFVADVFIHGTGGGNYDQVTDMIIRSYYSVEPGSFFVASLTKFPSVNDGDLEDEMEEQRLLLRDMKSNPDKYVGSGNPLAEEKQRLIHTASGKLTKEDYKRLSEVRRKLSGVIENDIVKEEEKYRILSERMENVRTVQRRDFPYFIFTNEQLTNHETFNTDNRGQL